MNAGKDLLCGDGGKEEAGQFCHDGEAGAAEDFTDAVGHPEEGEDAEGGDEQGESVTTDEKREGLGMG